MKTEAERRFEAFIQRTEATFGERVSDVKRAETLALFRAIFDPLPPEPVKSLGQILCERRHGVVAWSEEGRDEREDWEADAQAVIDAHEARRPKPTVDDVARAFWAAHGNVADWEDLSDENRNYWRKYARAVFPLFGVEP